MCDDTCWFLTNDGECDDGGPHSQYYSCGLGHDCNDCGDRAYVVDDYYNSCDNTCVYHNDGDCDDGGFGSEYGLCTPRAQFWRNSGAILAQLF